VKKLEGVHPALVAKVTRILFASAELGFPMLVTDGVRTAAEQAALYAQGRTVPGPDVSPSRPMGRTVTNSDGVRKPSNHQVKADGFGHAVDLCFLVDGKPSWDDALPWYLYGAMAKALGLEWGGAWRSKLVDRPHIELPEDVT